MRSFKFVQAVVLCFAFATGVANAAEYKQGEILVKYKDSAVRTHETMNSLYSNVGVSSVRRYTGVMQGFEQLLLNDNIKVEDAIAEAMRSGDVEYAQPNFIMRALPIKEAKVMDAPTGGIPCIPGFNIPGCDPKAQLPCLIPGIFPPGCSADGAPGQNPGKPVTRPALNPAPAEVSPAVADPSLDQAYGIAKIGAPEAWKLHKGDKKFIVADIDTGIDYNHEDLSFNLWRNPDTAKDTGTVGYDFVHNDTLPFDDNEHGTHTAGTIGAVGGNGIGVSGVSQRVSLMALKFLSGEGSGTTADAVRAIDFAIAHGAKVLSNSWGGKGDQDNKALGDAIDRAKAADILFVAAAGNDSADNDGTDASFPAALPNDNIISVAATDSNDSLAFFSNFGKKTVHVAAPGVKVYSTVPGSQYKEESGTSMACPHVAGAAALIWSAHPSWNYMKVKQVLMDTSDKLPVLQEKTISGGRINVLSALKAN